MTDIKQYEPLWGAWYVDEQLGEGSYGKVYKVHKEEFGRTYEAAVKMLSIPQNESDILQAKSEGLDEESARSYFQAFVTDIIQEVDLMNAFRGNSNIVSLEDHKVIEKQGEIGWDIIIRMELLETLSSYITKHPMTQAEIIKLGIHICQALELCAKHNTIHRDIKPDNIFVSKYGDYKLGDFGIARQIERTMSGLSKKGTYQYMAPEVFRGDEYGSSVDTYSLGIVMYRFLNKNRAPFLPEYPNPITPKDRDEALQRRMSGEPLPEIQGIDEKLNSLVLKACSYERANRFQNATEMKNELESLSVNNADLSQPIIEISQHEEENTNSETSETLTTKWINDTEERTKIIFSKHNIAPLQDQNSLSNENQINADEIFIKKLAIFSTVFWGILACLTLLSSDKNDILIFLPLHALCISQCFLKFENKILDRLFICYLICYVLFSTLINSKFLDYSFLILTLNLLSLTAYSKQKLAIINGIALVCLAIILGIWIFKYAQHIPGISAVPVLMLISAPAAILLKYVKKSKFNPGIVLLVTLQSFIIIVIFLGMTGIIKNHEMLYNIINANFPGLLYERFPWWIHWRFFGILIQIFAFMSFLILSIKIFYLRNDNKN